MSKQGSTSSITKLNDYNEYGFYSVEIEDNPFLGGGGFL